MENILVVGAGPVGLYTALRLGQQGFKVDVFERASEIDSSPRAAGYYGPILTLFQKSGLWDAVSTAGYEENGLVFRSMPVVNSEGGKTFGKEIGYLKDKQLMLPQSRLAHIIEKAAIATGNITVHYQKEATAIENTKEHVTLTVKNVETGDVDKFTGAYLLGTDGGRSTVRSLLKIKFPGHSWPERIIATNLTRVNDEIAHVSLNFIIDPVHWTVTIPLERPELGQESLWRVAIAIDSKDPRSDEELIAPDHLESLYEKVMVGKRPLKYEIKQKTVYHIHQRLAATMKRGRCLLAGDAAHLNCPVGAMGLATGLLDAEALADAVTMVLHENYPESVLDIYSDVRRNVFGMFVDPTTTQNKTRVQSDPDDVEREDGFLRMLRNPALNNTENFEKYYNAKWVTNMRSTVAAIGLKPRNHS